MDTLTPKQRSERMSQVKSKDSKPEMFVRRLIHGMGYRYRLHRPDLPGKPDLAFGPRKKVIFVHGCFWHRHDNCKLARLPKSKLDFWLPKLEANKARDAKNQALLDDLGWKVLVIWECQVHNDVHLASIIRSFLEENGEEP